MELIRPKEPLEFKYKDVVFLVKAQAADADRMEVLASGTGDGGARITIPRAEFHRALIRCFVVDWRGVTIDKKEVPYSFEVFMRYFPTHEKKGHSVVVDLANFIVEKTDIFKKDELEKKG